MQTLFALLLQFSGKAWAALAVAVLCGGAVTVFYFSPAPAGSNATPGNPPAVVQAGHVPAPGLGPQAASVPVVPEANAGLVLIPVLAAMLLVASRQLWLARPAATAGAQPSPGEPNA